MSKNMVLHSPIEDTIIVIEEEQFITKITLGTGPDIAVPHLTRNIVDFFRYKGYTYVGEL
jgi:hypothetical protein